MQCIADLHIHSKYSRACSRELTIPNIAKACKTKGIDLVSTGDFTHPAWFEHIKKELTEVSPGIYRTKNSPTKFIVGTEVACIYKKGGQCRRLHLCVFSPNIETAEKVILKLESRNFNLGSDGRPILGVDAKSLLEMLLEIDKNIVMIPAHAWTPWFSVFGSKSGFNSLEECFEELTPYIFSVETGLSSDPPMNWHLSALDEIALVSNSDAHSLDNLGREANVFETGKDADYRKIFDAVKYRDEKKFLFTIEFFPEQGKYHFDGHRICGVSFEPKETKKHGGICPVCKKPLTIGVLNRVDELADRDNPDASRKIPYKNLVPLKTIIAAAVGNGEKTKKVSEIYQKLIAGGKNEFNVLLNLAANKIAEASSPQIAEAIERARKGQIKILPGFDGEYGRVEIFSQKDFKNPAQQKLM